MDTIKYLLLVLFLSSCSNFKVGNERREFKVNKLWVRSSTQLDQLHFRKINRMSPVISGNLLISGNAIDGLAAFDIESGGLLWRQKITNGVEASATQIKDRLFVGANDGNFYNIEMSTGNILWKFKGSSEFLAEPLLDNGILYVLAGNNTLYALDAATGKQQWLYNRQDTSSLSVRGGSKPAIKNGHIFLGFSDGAVVSLNSKNGQVIWETVVNKNKRFRDVDSTPVIIDNNLYISGYDNQLYCLSIVNGNVLWRMDGGGYHGITVYDDKMYYPTTQGQVIALDKNGNTIWKYNVSEGISTQVKVFKGVAVFGESQGSLVFLDANTGKKIGNFDPGRGILSNPSIDAAKNRIYFISNEANVYAVEALWGRPDWLKENL